MKAENLPHIQDRFVLCVIVCGRLRACFFFVCLIKADVVQSRGLRGEIKVLLPPRFGGGGSDYR